MKILVFNWRDKKNPAAGGAEKFTHEVMERLVERGHEVTLLTSEFEGSEHEEKINDVRIIRKGSQYTVYRKTRKYYQKNLKGEFDVVIDEINTRPFNTVEFVEEPVIALIHQKAEEFWHYEMPFPLDYIGRYILEPYWLKKYREVPTITVSESTKKDLEELGFKDIRVVPEGIDIEPLGEVPEKNETLTLLFVGRMKEAKKPEDALKAFQKIETEIDEEVQMEVVGDGYKLEELKDKYSQNNINFNGYVSRKEKIQKMKESHLLLVPGVREGWGLVVTEANSQGTPAVGYNVHGLRDSIKDQKTGLLSKPDPESLAEKTTQLITSKQQLQKYFQNALKDSRNYNWDKTTDKIEEKMEEVK